MRRMGGLQRERESEGIMRRTCRGFWASAIPAFFLVTTAVASADTPPSAKKLIADLKLAPEVTNNWEEEQNVSGAWIEGAKREGKLRINGAWESTVFRDMVKPFSERYPFIKVTYSRGSNDTRVRAPLLAFRQGQYTTDLIQGIDSTLNDFREARALADISDLPNMKSIPEDMKSRDWVGGVLRYWCMSYNPTQIGKDQMPKTWDDLVATTQLRGGKLALWRDLASWLLPLWKVKGEQWSTDYARKLFTIVQPQKRNEGSVALVNLVIAGEYSASLAAAEYQVKPGFDQGAPIGFHCPEPVPLTTVSLGVLRDNPDINASKIFLNWLLSKEGQIAQYAAEKSPPIRADLHKLGFMPFPEAIAGKQIAFRSLGLLGDDIKAMSKVLNPYWENSDSQ